MHENEIRKEKGDFNFFQNRQHKTEFLDALTTIIERSNFILISCVIEKEKLRSHASSSENPYHIALGFCLETLYGFLCEKNQQQSTTHVIVERRGKKEDDELELEFRRVCDGENRLNHLLPFAIHFGDKKVNSTGLQLADLVARPIGMHVLRPQQKNRAFNVLKQKLFCNGGRLNAGTGYENWGLRLFPGLESEKPR